MPNQKQYVMRTTKKTPDGWGSRRACFFWMATIFLRMHENRTPSSGKPVGVPFFFTFGAGSILRTFLNAVKERTHPEGTVKTGRDSKNIRMSTYVACGNGAIGVS